MFISLPTNAHRNSIKWILKLLRHIPVFLHHPHLKYIYVSYRKHLQNKILIIKTSQKGIPQTEKLETIKHEEVKGI